MDKNQAKELLSLHSTRNSDIYHLKSENGFLVSLRPFQGELNEENFFEVMECLRALKNEYASPMMKQIIKLREKYDLHMKVERYVSDEIGVPSGDEKYIRQM